MLLGHYLGGPASVASTQELYDKEKRGLYEILWEAAKNVPLLTLTSYPPLKFSGHWNLVVGPQVEELFFAASLRYRRKKT